MTKHKMRSMTRREMIEFYGVILLMVEAMIAGAQGIAWIAFDLADGKAFLFATLILAPILAALWLKSMGGMIEADETDEVGA